MISLLPPEGTVLQNVMGRLFCCFPIACAVSTMQISFRCVRRQQWSGRNLKIVVCSCLIRRLNWPVEELLSPVALLHWGFVVEQGFGFLVSDGGQRLAGCSKTPGDLLFHVLESNRGLGSNVGPQCTLEGEAAGLSAVSGSAGERLKGYSFIL